VRISRFTAADGSFEEVRETRVARINNLSARPELTRTRFDRFFIFEADPLARQFSTAEERNAARDEFIDENFLKSTVDVPV
jgi:hypothetical protein